MFQPNICPTCGTPIYYEDCDLCAGEGYIDAFDIDPLRYDLGDIEMCNQCHGTGGWWTCPSCQHLYPTEKDRTASDTASTTPAIPPATPLAGCQQHRQQEDAL